MNVSQGMEYLHKSPLKFHGRLKSSNCLLDSRLVIKLTDFGFHHLRHVNYYNENEKFTGLHATFFENYYAYSRMTTNWINTRLRHFPNNINIRQMWPKLENSNNA